MLETLGFILRLLFGLGVLVAICWAFSSNRRAVSWRLVGSGLGLQFLLAFIILKVPGADLPIVWLSNFFVQLLDFTYAGSRFVLGFLAEGPMFWAGVNDAMESTEPRAPPFSLIIAFYILPIVIFFSALTSLLYYLGLLQKIVFGMAWLLQKTMGLSGSEALSAAANVFVGQTEAPLAVKPYIPKMSRSELLCLMTGGMATIAGSVFGAYVAILGSAQPDMAAEFAKHLLTASILSAPAAIVCAKLLIPQTEPVETNLEINKEKLGENAFDAIAQGTSQGMQLALNIAGMLIVFLALIAMLNAFFGWTGGLIGLNGWIDSISDGAYNKLSLELILGVVFAPVAFLIGADVGSMLQVGQLLGIKLVANEFIAYEMMAGMLAGGEIADKRSIIIATYALCGFANVGSVGILIGGFAVLAPNRRAEISLLAVPALLGGTIACLMTGCVAAFFLAG
jgi:CNT family concentrative nucleoside transporter